MITLQCSFNPCPGIVSNFALTFETFFVNDIYCYIYYMIFIRWCLKVAVF